MSTQNRKDQVQAHLFVMGRLSGGLLRADPDAAETPSTRTWRGLVWGVLLVVLACLVTTLYGLIRPGGATSWKEPGTLVLVRETGARYLFVDGALHPVLNEASARLIAGDRLRVTDVAESSLAGTERGPALGIVGAPDGLPAAGLPRETWSVCALPGSSSPDGPPLTSVAVGVAGTVTGLDESRGVLVSAPDEGLQLVWNGRRFAVDGEHGTKAALGWAGVVATRVAPSFLQSLDAGPPLAPPEVARRGAAGPRLSGAATRIGQLFTASGQHYLLTEEGLVPLGVLDRLLLSGDPRTQRDAYKGAEVRELSLGPADLAAHTAPASVTVGNPALPRTAPGVSSVDPDESVVCVRTAPTDDGWLTTVALAARGSVPGTVPAVQVSVSASCTPADRVWVRPGSGALVRARSGAGTGSSEYLVTDAGVSYPLAPRAAQQLGYQASSAVRLPYRLLRLFPQGPLLDPAAANRAGPETAGGPNAGGAERPRPDRSYTAARKCGTED
ncbi:type VII secretion protein EccB [Streptomyces sp. NBC_00101]|uniref:type VII secretion protein EccB n=1 Tax=Streptomyces sp. NBC_00101 TaxID=2975651 RepID=UPI003245DE1F